MVKAVEEKLAHCNKCGKKTIHVRNINKTGLVMFLVHFILTILTLGAWLVLLLIWMLLTTKFGGWTCQECGE